MQQRLMFMIGACLLANGVVSAALAEPQAIPGSRVTLEAPADFVTTDRFAGLISSKLGISIVVMDVPAVGYDQIAVGMTPETLATRGVMSAKIGTLEGRAQPHVFITAEQGGTVDKFLLLTKNGAHGTLVTINVPKATLSAGQISRAQIDGILRSIAIGTIAAPVKLAFSIGHAGLLKPVTEPVGQTLMFTVDGARDPSSPTPGRILFIAVASHSPIPTGQSIMDLAALALKAIASTTEVAVTATREITIQGLKGIEHQATAKAANGAPLVIYQVMLVNPSGGYFRMVGQAPAIEAATYMPEFAKLAESFRLTP